jgi:pyruvate/2-oxoglutarate dehydrogenase complex dihydrolipoamide dehydrogenase (E3) component
MMTDPTGVSSL